MVHIASVDQDELGIGLALMLVSFFMPLFFTVSNFNVFDSLKRALQNGDVVALIAAAVQLVALNSLRGIPHYVGAYFIGESVEFQMDKKRVWLINAVMIVLLLQATYLGIEAIHDIRYDFSIPAVLVSMLVVLFRRLDYQYISLPKKAGLIIVFLTAFQFLDIMPAVSRLPVGRGETSWDIKQAAVLLGAETALNMTAGIGVIMFCTFGLLIFFQLRVENNLRELSVLKEQSEAIRIQAQLNEMKNRTNQEMQYLVHDLKSPLTAMQTLVGVLKMENEMEERTGDVEYLTRIEQAGEQMNRMITEILYEDHHSPITTKELLDVALAQSSVTEYAEYIQVDNQVPQAIVSANRMLFPRVLINLMQNSAQAIPEDRAPVILLKVERRGEKDGSRIVFSVSDNGRGIDGEKQEAIWSRGVSGRNSSGLGLAFVRSVVEGMDGEIQMKSIVGSGTEIDLILPEKGE